MIKEYTSSSGTHLTNRKTAAAPTLKPWLLNIFFPWYTSKSSTRPFGEARTNTCRSVGFGLPGIYCLAGQWPVKGMICSSMQTLLYLGRLRQPWLTWSGNGLTLQRMPDSFVSCDSRSSTILSFSACRTDPVIFLLKTGTFVFLAQNKMDRVYKDL